jgi:transcriptional regulator with XRE-family HTH domain
MGKYDVAPTMAAGLVRLARDTAGMTQAQLAAAAGVTQQSISAYETGRKEPTLPTLKRMLAAAGLEMRIRLEPIDRHDEVLRSTLEALPLEARAELEQSSRERAAAARLRRVRGH